MKADDDPGDKKYDIRTVIFPKDFKYIEVVEKAYGRIPYEMGLQKPQSRLYFIQCPE